MDFFTNIGTPIIYPSIFEIINIHDWIDAEINGR